ncbi:Nramp family divalent metal transporter [Streptomyces sp. AM 2-1-1]|uniref:Nramp family divalent metal transporter n=1 Tax=Streptomyces sp. AM 2-1-1 TaxID=3028709 RepID=UPI0023B8CF9D|nr:Nramp family divalent metal transporter [Streptomyces sp. AM 2-1-1]WEH41198.1 Nramp family divalent metal transporter [Streptomyces sp. AM 2-1-1]
MFDARAYRRVPQGVLSPPTGDEAPGRPPAEGAPAAAPEAPPAPEASPLPAGARSAAPASEATPAPETAPPPSAAPPRSRPGALRVKLLLAMLGPALVVSVAYVDPGNYATNMTAGAHYGPLLLWVVALANVLAVFVQYLACKAGVATGQDLPQLCRAHAPRGVTRALWVQAELVAMATELAEFVGGAVALHLLIGVPMFPAACIVAGCSLVLVVLAPEGRRRFNLVIASLLLVILAGFVYQSLVSGSWGGAIEGMRPRFADSQSILLTTGMVGATVMPHVIYLHSSLGRSAPGAAPAEKRRTLRAHRAAIVLALGVAGLVNASMLTIASAALHGGGGERTETLEGFHHGLGQALGPAAALAFALALLASGLASSGVGTFAGQVIMSGFLRRRVPITVRRLVTMTPPLLILALGVDPTLALVLSQVVLSFGIPLALAPLLVFTARRSVMGGLVNRPVTTVAAAVVVLVISSLNIFLVVRVVGG